jgi:hypothetical protein
MRGKERELIVLRSENGETWKEHQFDSKNEDLAELLNGMDEGIDPLGSVARDRVKWVRYSSHIPGCRIQGLQHLCRT